MGKGWYLFHPECALRNLFQKLQLLNKKVLKRQDNLSKSCSARQSYEFKLVFPVAMDEITILSYLSSKGLILCSVNLCGLKARMDGDRLINDLMANDIRW